MACDTKISLNSMGTQLHCNKKNILREISMYVRIIMFHEIIRLCIPRKKNTGMIALLVNSDVVCIYQCLPVNT